MKVDFIVIGAMKCATSTVRAYCEDHSDVFMVANLDPNFFCHDDKYAKGLDWYHSLFRDRARESICGEGSNSYAGGALYPHTVARMAAYNPGLKLVYMVRHPLARIVSAWIQNRADDGDFCPPTLDRAVIERPELYVDQSLYWKNISLYREAFPDKQIFVGFMEDLNRDPSSFFAELTGFLGVSANPIVKRGHLNPSEGKQVLSPLFTTINSIPFAPGIKSLLPGRVKRFIKQRFFSQVLPGRPDFSPDIKARVIDAVRDDAETFLARYGKPRDFWAL